MLKTQLHFGYLHLLPLGEVFNSLSTITPIRYIRQTEELQVFLYLRLTDYQSFQTLDYNILGGFLQMSFPNMCSQSPEMAIIGGISGAESTICPRRGS